jgi:hypothetical protein
MDFNGGIQFQIGTIKIHTLAHATANTTRIVQYLIFDASSHHHSGKFQNPASV